MTNPTAPVPGPALVTGAAKGIGAASAVALAEEGWSPLVLVDRDEPQLATLQQDMRRRGYEVLALARDVVTTDPSEVYERVRRETGAEVRALVNNAGILRLGPALESSHADFTVTFDVNVRATFFWTQQLVAMSEAPPVIVNISSQLAFVGGENRALYAASKAAVLQMTRALAVEWARRGVRVNTVAPGPTRTAMTEQRLDDPAARAVMLQRIPMGRAGNPEDVGAAVAFLCSPRAQYITGSTIHVDGGYTAA